jgi:hypothetical protein
VANGFGGWQVDDIRVVLVGVACVEPCPGDVNGDGMVDVFDFADLADGFGIDTGATREDGDLNGDGLVDVFDFGDVSASFGDSCP